MEITEPTTFSLGFTGSFAGQIYAYLPSVVTVVKITENVVGGITSSLGDAVDSLTIFIGFRAMEQGNKDSARMSAQEFFKNLEQLENTPTKICFTDMSTIGIAHLGFEISSKGNDLATTLTNTLGNCANKSMKKLLQLQIFKEALINEIILMEKDKFTSIFRKLDLFLLGHFTLNSESYSTIIDLKNEMLIAFLNK
jgi:hypothetical protein